MGLYPQVIQAHQFPRESLSAVARLGQQLFFDPRLSGSGQQSCSSCHSPVHAYAAPNAMPVQLGGRDLRSWGARAVPSLTYLYRAPAFSIGPDTEIDGDDEHPSPARMDEPAIHQGNGKTIENTNLSLQRFVPRGGLFWDGRADTLQQQAAGPLFNPVEMAAGSEAEVANRLKQAPYANEFRLLFGPSVFLSPQQVVSEALFALSRFQMEDASFHAYTSHFDRWMQGRERFSRQEVRGYLAFNDTRRGNCAACHDDKPGAEGLAPLFTDAQFEALGVPRNPLLKANADSRYFDLGLCGPFRSDLVAKPQYCGMFRTPTLRNVATRQVFFHNGVFHRLEDVLAFYNYRDVAPEKIYPRLRDGQVALFNDMPSVYQIHIDRVDLPFTHKLGDSPPMSDQDMADIIVFLKTLSDAK